MASARVTAALTLCALAVLSGGALGKATTLEPWDLPVDEPPEHNPVTLKIFLSWVYGPEPALAVWRELLPSGKEGKKMTEQIYNDFSSAATTDHLSTVYLKHLVVPELKRRGGKALEYLNAIVGDARKHGFDGPDYEVVFNEVSSRMSSDGVVEELWESGLDLVFEIMEEIVDYPEEAIRVV